MKTDMFTRLFKQELLAGRKGSRSTGRKASHILSKTCSGPTFTFTTFTHLFSKKTIKEKPKHSL